MGYTNDDHKHALQAVRNGVANKEQERKVAEAAKQAGSRGEEAKRALQGKR